jgi:hypothetical protein
MSIDLSKLTPLPHRIIDEAGPFVATSDGFPVMLSEFDNLADLQFWLLARNAFAGDLDALVWWEMNRVRPAENARG